MKRQVNQERVKELLNYIEDKETFVLELIAAINEAIESDDFSPVENVLDEWEASAELCSVPGLVERVRKRCKSLAKAGLIHER